MQVYRNLGELPAGETVLSVGNFDGVHRAHQLVLSKVVERARALKANAVAVTFDPHPVSVLRPQNALKLITPRERKLDLLKETGIDAAVVLQFNKEFSQTPALDFARLLRDGLHAKEVHEGANFRFGHGAKGEIAHLREMGRELGFEVVVYPELTIRGVKVSSSRIRELLQCGDVSRARALLGRPFSIRAPIAKGRGLGSKHTVPTINLAQYSELIPKNGVYITRARVAGRTFDSASNIGMRPTFEKESFAIETHLLDFVPMDLAPNSEVELCFLKRIREERKFSSLEALREQIGHDVASARRYFRLAAKIRR